MELLLVLIGVFLLLSSIFIVTHLYPLTKDEIKSLGDKRRNKQIRTYFSFDIREFAVNKEFKKRMNPNGTFHRINESLFGFPATTAALLKYKKHEWIIIAFEKDKKVDMVWLNKGFDRSGVSPYMSVKGINETAKQENQTSILIFHNHPNINPNYYDCSRPSSKDIESANEFAQVFNANGINLLEFVCERGKHYEYFISPTDTFLPLVGFIEDINNVNGQSKLVMSTYIWRFFQNSIILENVYKYAKNN